MWRILNSKGFTLTEVMMAAAITISLVATGATLMKNTAELKKKSDAYDALTNYRTDLIASLRSSDAIARMASSPLNPNSGCLKSLQNCGTASTGEVPLTVIDPSNNRRTDMTATNFGFGVDGQTCTSYPSLSCPFRYETTWYSKCAGGVTCTTPQIKANGVLKVFAGFPAKIDAHQFDFAITLGQVIGSYEQSCTSIGGTYKPGEPPTCELPMVGDCDPGQYVYGYNKVTKKKLCRPLFQNIISATCPDGQVMVGVDSGGKPTCKNMVANLGCSSLSDPKCAPYYCQANPTKPGCAPIPASMGNGGDGDGGCDGSDGC